MLIPQVSVLQLLVVDDSAVVHEVVVMGLIKMGMGVGRGLASTGGPPCMTDAHVAALVVFYSLSADLFHTVFLHILLSIFCQMGFGCLARILTSKRHDAGTIIASILKQRHSILDDDLCVIGGRDNAYNSTAGILAIQPHGPQGEPESERQRPKEPPRSEQAADRIHAKA